jgi:hypothetical protein
LLPEKGRNGKKIWLTVCVLFLYLVGKLEGGGNFRGFQPEVVTFRVPIR